MNASIPNNQAECLVKVTLKRSEESRRRRPMVAPKLTVNCIPDSSEVWTRTRWKRANVEKWQLQDTHEMTSMNWPVVFKHWQLAVIAGIAAIRDKERLRGAVLVDTIWTHTSKLRGLLKEKRLEEDKLRSGVPKDARISPGGALEAKIFLSDYLQLLPPEYLCCKRLPTATVHQNGLTSLGYRPAISLHDMAKGASIMADMRVLSRRNPYMLGDREPEDQPRNHWWNDPRRNKGFEDLFLRPDLASINQGSWLRLRSDRETNQQEAYCKELVTWKNSG